MRVVEQICDRVAIMNRGVIEETGFVKDIFLNPKSETSKRLVLSADSKGELTTNKKCIRIVFDGISSSEPILADLVLATQVKLNIMGANTEDIGGSQTIPSRGGVIAFVTILGYSAMAGFVGGGGLGAIAVNYGYYRFKPDVMFAPIRYGKTTLDNGALTKELCKVAEELLKKHPDIGAILLECSDLPPYAKAIQSVTGLPVFDFNTMIDWVYHSVVQKTYFGYF